MHSLLHELCEKLEEINTGRVDGGMPKICLFISCYGVIEKYVHLRVCCSIDRRSPGNDCSGHKVGHSRLRMTNLRAHVSVGGE